MNCPICNVPLQPSSGETVTEVPTSGEYTRSVITHWHAYTCPVCRKSTGPRGHEVYARAAVRGWSRE